jgi:glycosyltransferase involved in cell wall biosynthesis
LHLIETLGSGGAERLLFTNLRHLNRDEIESEVITVFDRDEYWREPIERLGVRVRSLNGQGYRDIPRGVRRLRKVIAEISPNLIHTHLFAANIIGRIAGRLSAIPVISSIHNPEYEPEVSAGAPRSVRQKIAIARRVDQMTARACARMIAVSEYVKRSTVRRLGYPSTKIKVIYNPIDLSETIDDAVDRTGVLADLNIPVDSLLLLHVGRLSPQKGFIDAIRAMPEVLRSIPNARLVSVGAQADPQYKSKVVGAIESLELSDAVRLAGERRDVSRLQNACDAFVFPSHFEGLGIALVEAMAARRACVASDIPPLTEFMIDGVNGILVTPGEPDRLAKAIIELLRDASKREELGDAARATAVELFDPNKAAEKLKEIYFSTVR